MVAKNVQMKRVEISENAGVFSLGTGSLIMFMTVMREAGFWEGKINLTFENTCLPLKAEDWAVHVDLGSFVRGREEPL